MKRMLAAAVTGVLAIGLAVAGVTTAFAGASNDPTPYAVNANGITLPAGSTFSSGGINDGNVKYIPLSDYTAGQTYKNAPASWHVTNINFHLEGKTGYGLGLEGASVLPFNQATSDGAFRGTLPVSTGYCIVWVQVQGFNEHFGEGGQDPICTSIPKDASAVVAITPATCDSAETLNLISTVNATWGSPTGATGPGTYSVTATATTGHVFDDGSKTKTFTGPLLGTDSSNGCTTIEPVAVLLNGQCYWDSSQKGSFKTVTFEYDNSASNVAVKFSVAGWSVYDRTVAPKDVVHVSAQSSWVGGVGYTVIAGGKSFALSLPAFASCPPTVSACTTDGNGGVSTNLAPNGWTFTETRSQGSNTYVSGGLAIETHNDADNNDGGAQDQRKAAGYKAVSIPLSLIGAPSIDYASASGSLPGINLTIDKDGDGGNDGNLVYEPTLFGVGNWWSTQNLGVVSSQVIPNPSYQKSFGTLNDFLGSWPSAKIIAVGYSLGSGAVGAGVIHSITVGCLSYSFDYTPLTAGIPARVTFVDVCGVKGDEVNIPALAVGVTDYSYVIDDQRDADGVGTVTVTAKEGTGYVFAPGVTTSWSNTFTSDSDNKCVKIPGDPKSTDQVCDLDNGGVIQGIITVVGGTGLTYTIQKTDLPAVADVDVLDGPTKVAPGQYLVTAKALPGFTLTTPTSWPYTIADLAQDCDNTTLVSYDPALSAEGPTCSSATGYLIVAAGDPLSYYVGTTQLATGKNAYAPGTYTVTAVAPPGDGVSGVNPFDITIAAASAICGQLTTLALTGAGGVPIYLLVAAAMLMAGAVIMVIRAPRRAALHRA